MIDVTVVHPLGSKSVSSAWHTFGAAAKWAEKRNNFTMFSVMTWPNCGPDWAKHTRNPLATLGTQYTAAYGHSTHHNILPATVNRRISGTVAPDHIPDN